MNILLINVDSRWNMAIRRMYAYYTQQGHEVEMRDLKLSGYPHKRKVTVDASGFDQVYVSNIFEQNADRVNVKNCDQVVFRWLIEHRTRCEFNQGLDFRLVNDENLDALARLNYEGDYIFAFDDPKYQKLLDKKIVQIKKYISKPWKLKFYIYYHPDMDLTQLVDRVEWCRARECKPYIMRDAACWDCDRKDFLIDYAAYCNQPSFFKNMSFYEFLVKRAEAGSISGARAAQHAAIYDRIVRGEEAKP